VGKVLRLYRQFSGQCSQGTYPAAYKEKRRLNPPEGVKKARQPKCPFKGKLPPPLSTGQGRPGHHTKWVRPMGARPFSSGGITKRYGGQFFKSTTFPDGQVHQNRRRSRPEKKRQKETMSKRKFAVNYSLLRSSVLLGGQKIMESDNSATNTEGRYATPSRISLPWEGIDAKLCAFQEPALVEAKTG